MIKKFLSFFALCLLTSPAIEAAIERGAEEDIDLNATSIGIDSNQMKASKVPGVIWSFELKNKDKINFKITVQNGSKTILYNHEVAPSKGSDEKSHFYLRLSGLDLKKPTLIDINNPSASLEKAGVAIPGNGNTIFITYEKGKLRTQSGTGIFSKETQSGLSLKNNIQTVDMLNRDDALIEFWNLLSIADLGREYAKYTKKQTEELSRAQRLQVHNALDKIASIMKSKGGRAAVAPELKAKVDAFLGLAIRENWKKFDADTLAKEYKKYSAIEDKYILTVKEQERIAKAKMALDELYYKKTGKYLK